MTDNELLLALSDMLDKKLKSELQPMKDDIQGIKDDMQGIKDDMQGIKDDMQGIKDDMQDIKDDMQGMKDDMQGIKDDMQDIKDDMETVKQKVTKIELILENEIRVNIQRLAEGHLDLSRNLHEAVKLASDIKSKQEIQEIYLNIHETKLKAL